MAAADGGGGRRRGANDGGERHDGWRETAAVDDDDDGARRRLCGGDGGIIMVNREVLIPTCFSIIPVCEITEAPVNRFTVKYYVAGGMGGGGQSSVQHSVILKYHR